MTYLMSNTLPTVIGMGIVSQTTQTMFGRGKSRTTTRKRKTTTKRVAITKIGGRAVHKGKRGGTYIVKNGRRVYL